MVNIDDITDTKNKPMVEVKPFTDDHRPLADLVREAPVKVPEVLEIGSGRHLERHLWPVVQDEDVLHFVLRLMGCHVSPGPVLSRRRENQKCTSLSCSRRLEVESDLLPARYLRGK